MTYTIYGGELSLFTRKLEAAMIFYGADFRMARKDEDNREMIEMRSGTHQVPVLHTPENWMIGDTTPILNLLDSRFPGREMFPEGAAGVLVNVLEEFFDEWIARVMVHYRWHYPESAKFAANKMGDGDPAVVERMLNWGPRACRATGTDSQHQRVAAEKEYLQLMAAAETQLQTTAYLLGDRPTALDCIVLGGVRAHTNMDPDPQKAMTQFPTVIDWANRRANDYSGSGELAAAPETTPFAQYVLSVMAPTYGRYVIANRDAQQAGAKAFHCEVFGEDVSYLSRPYPEKSRQMVIDRIDALRSDQTAVEQVNAWLQEAGLSKVFS